jgi:hypothetical protein
MTRSDFIKLVKADQRAQLWQVGSLMGAFVVFGGLGSAAVRCWGEQMLRPNRPYFWLLAGLTLIFGVAAIGIVRVGNKFLLKCPHCCKCLGGFPAQVVVASTRCGFCGERIIDND